MKRLVLLLCWMLMATPLCATTLNSRADEIKIDPASIPEPPLNRTKKSFVTRNKFGFDAVRSEHNWVIDTFLTDVKPKMTVLDVGAGYGALSRETLDRGATVISNDIDCKHLLYILKHLTREKRSRLHLNSEDIRTLKLENNSLDLIAFDQVLHFFKGAEIDALLTKSYRWLKPHGKIYIIVMSNEHHSFRHKIDYDKNKEWPGEDLVVPRKHLPKLAYALPATVHVMSIQTLRNHLEKIGYKIERADYVPVKNGGGHRIKRKNAEGDNDKDLIGIIAVKE